MQQRREGASGLQNEPALWHWNGAEMTQAPPMVEQMPAEVQHPLQHVELVVHVLPSARHMPPSRAVGWQVRVLLHESPSQHGMAVMHDAP